jgi:excisionase family DNA binding protein
MAYLRDPKGRRCVSIGEAAKRKAVSKEAIRQAIKRGVLEATAMMDGHLHLIPLDSLAKYVPSESHTRVPLKGVRPRRIATAAS